MPRTVQLKTNFVAGELDPLLKGRSDFKHYYNGAELMRNVIVLPQGGGRSRPGSSYVWEVPMIPEIDGGGVSEVRLAEFQFSTEQTYLFVFYHKAVAIFRDGVLVATKTTPYTSDQINAELTAGGDLVSSGISWAQTRDTMIVFHQDYQPRKIKRGATHSDWTVSNYALKNIPNFDFGDVTYVNGVDEVQEIEFPAPGSQGNWTDGDTFRLILEDEETNTIRYDGVAATLASRMQTALRKLPNVQASGIAVTVSAGGPNTVGATFQVAFTGDNGDRPWGSMAYDVVSSQQVPTIDIIVSTEGEYPGEPVWSNTRGWPRCGVIFQGRLWMAGTTNLPNTIWASRSGAADDFNNKKIDDDYGIQATSDTDDVPAFINIYAGRHLQIFSTAAEFYIPSSESDGVTPGNIVLRRTTSRGSKPGLRVHEVDGATIFVQKQGKALREMIFADVELAYQSNSISLLSSHLMRDPTDFALRRSTSTDDADYFFLPNIDGTMSVFCTLRTQDVNAMTLWNTNGYYDKVVSVLDDVYFAVRRFIDGEERKFIEIMDKEIMVDCGKAALSGFGFDEATLSWLPNTPIEHMLDGINQQPITSDEDGKITFARHADTSYIAGLRYPDVLPDEYPGLIWLIKTLPIELDLPEGAAMGRRRRIVNLTARLYETTALIVNRNRISFQQFGPSLLDQRIKPYTGLKQVRGFLGWNFEGGIVLGSDVSTKATVLGLAFAVSI